MKLTNSEKIFEKIYNRTKIFISGVEKIFTPFFMLKKLADSANQSQSVWLFVNPKIVEAEKILPEDMKKLFSAFERIEEKRN